MAEENICFAHESIQANLAGIVHLCCTQCHQELLEGWGWIILKAWSLTYLKVDAAIGYIFSWDWAGTSTCGFSMWVLSFLTTQLPSSQEEQKKAVWPFMKVLEIT